MKPLTQVLQSAPEYQQLLEALAQGQSPVAVTGLSALHRSQFAANLAQEGPLLLLCSEEAEAKRMAQDLSHFSAREIPLLTSRPQVYHPVEGSSRQWEQERLRIFHQLKQDPAPLLVATIEGLLQPTLSPDLLAQASLSLQVGESLALESLALKLVEAGYQRGDQVEGVGQFSIRGGILDVYSPSCNQPIRLDFFGDEIDGMGFFDVESQRRTENVEKITLLPVAEVLPHLAPGGLSGLLSALEQQNNPEMPWFPALAKDRELLAQTQSLPAPDRYLRLVYPQLATALDHLAPGTQILLSECNKIADRAKTLEWQEGEDLKQMLEQGQIHPDHFQGSQSFSQLCHRLENYSTVFLDSFTLSSYPLPPKALLSLTAKQLPPFGGNLDTALEDVEAYGKAQFQVVVLVSTKQRGQLLLDQLQDRGLTASLDFALSALPKPGEILIALGGLSAGLEYPGLSFALLAEGQGTLVKKSRPSRKSQEVTNRQKLKSYADLSPGDLVVHEAHGIGRYLGMEQVTVDGIVKDYIQIGYAGTDQLLIPATQLDTVSKYIGGGQEGMATKKLSKLGGGSWEKAKTQAKKAVADLAKGLIQLYAQRSRLQGFAFSPDIPWQTEFEGQFPFVETEDQLRAVEEIKGDMEGPRPMDRLLCGDVGYGKTEVAFRAMMKCVLDGKQTAILVPTTVLARQHYLTALKRFQSYPVTVDVVSRFRTSAQMKETLGKVARGEIDILIGTHRLFQKDIVFKDLGLLVVDEEQRFGVSHKEKLKERFAQVDVLTLSATPIPRTLNMALSGIRDMSTLEEPPANRQPVQTYVMEENWGVLQDAMKRELERGGQVYFLHNRVDGIARTARHLEEMLGETAVVGVAHGRMGQEEIDQVMSAMTDGTMNVLVCTTIIETGIDLPNANTLIIQDADKLGLSQLHQIRGRVGRSSRRAFAYLTYRQGKILSDVASKRLSALREFAQFGSGFKIAMRDLEIRGAGNVLGPEQSGFLLSVGYDLYLKLLEEAVLTQQGLAVPKKSSCYADLPISASVPNRYVPVEEQRMDLYRRIAALDSQEEAEDLVDELIDRYGEPPPTVTNLIAVALLRGVAARCHVTDLLYRGGRLECTLEQVDFQVVAGLCNHPSYQKKLVLIPGDKSVLALKVPEKREILSLAKELLADFSLALEVEAGQAEGQMKCQEEA